MGSLENHGNMVPLERKRISRSDFLRRSSPSKRISPPRNTSHRLMYQPHDGKSCYHSYHTPDSPTTPRVSPALMEKETPSTARISPRSVSKKVRKLFNSTSAMATTYRFRRTSRASLSPSPRKLKASTVYMMAKPGKTAHHHCPWPRNF